MGDYPHAAQQEVSTPSKEDQSPPKYTRQKENHSINHIHRGRVLGGLLITTNFKEVEEGRLELILRDHK